MQQDYLPLKSPLSYRNQLARYFKSKGLPVEYCHNGFLINHIKVQISHELEYVNFIMLSPRPIIVSVPFATPSEIFAKYLRYMGNSHQCNLPNLSFTEILRSVQSRQRISSMN